MLSRFFTLLALISSLTGCGSGNSSSQQIATEVTVQDLHPAIVPIYSDPVFGSRCGLPLKCNDIVVVNCGAQIDGPQNYYNNSSGDVVMYCGGACIAPDPNNPKSCKSCPPHEWTCQSPP